MLERAQVRFWAPIVAAAGFFPMLTFLMLGVWYIRLYFAPIEFAAAASVQVERAQVGAATVPPPAAVPEPVPAPQARRPPEPLTMSAIVADAHSANFHPAQDPSPAEAPAMSPEPAALEPAMPMTVLIPPVVAPAEAPAAPPEHPTERITEAGAPPPDEKAPEFTSALPMFATFAVAPPMQFMIERAIPLPRPKPKVARVGRPEPPRPTESPRPTSLY